MMTKSTDVLKKFGNRIKELRLKKEITSQIAFANKSGLDRSYVGGLERGERNVSLINIERIAKTLGVTLEELFQI